MDDYLEGENSVVFEDATFSLTRLKISFVSALISWAELIANGEHSFVRILLCILLRARFRGSRCSFVQSWSSPVYSRYTLGLTSRLLFLC